MKRKIKTVNGDVLPNQTALAAWVNEEFGITCLRQTIQRWQTKWNPQFPAAKIDGTYRKSEARTWIETVFLKHRELNGAPANASLQSEADDAKLKAVIEEKEHERWEREQERGLWVRRQEAESAVKLALQAYHGFFRSRQEKRNPEARRAKLIELGVDPIIVAVFHSWDFGLAMETVTEMENQCEKEAMNDT